MRELAPEANGNERSDLLAPTTSGILSSSLADSGTIMELDKIDTRLLDLVQRNNRLTSDELGEKVGLSATGVQRRLKRLRSEGVIEADVSIVSPAAIGRHLTMLILVSFERDRTDIYDRFKRAIRNTAEIMSCFEVTGDADFALLVTAKDMEDYEQFTKRFFYQNTDIKGFKTMVVLNRVKVGFTLPMSGDAFLSKENPLASVTPSKEPPEFTERSHPVTRGNV